MRSKWMNGLSQKDKPTSIWMARLLVSGGLVALFLLAVFSITKGVYSISVSTVVDSFTQFESWNKEHLIIIDLRLPRVIASALVGAAFAVSGAIMQGMTRNPMADSGLMGLNAGAGFALAICFAFLPKLTYIQTIMFCFVGAAMGAILVNAIASVKRGKTSPMHLVLAGAAVTALLTALSQGIALCFDVAQNIMFWTVGSVAAANWDQIAIMTPFIIAALLGAMIISPHITVMSLGDEVATGLGMNKTLIRILCSVIVVILAGIAVSIVGAVGYVGLIIPHIVRGLVGVNYRLIIPASAVMGSLLMVLADLGARTLNPPFETPLGALIAIIGVPFFIYLARKQRRSL